jgi:poly-gamma-glutamate synthesis protein (capsule biosynthesis protein)
MKNSPVLAISWKGKFLVTILRCLLSIVALFKGRQWAFPLPDFEENPRYFSGGDLAYFSYKYYYKQLRHAEQKSGAEAHFEIQNFEKNDEPSTVSISLGGDLMPYAQISKNKCTNLWDEVGEFFFSSDIVFANLETPVDLSRKPGFVPEVMLKGMLFNANEETFEVFNGNNQFKGFDVLSLANNHALDQGVAGLNSTMQFLRQKNIQFTGAACAKENADDFPMITKNGVVIAFISFTFSLNEFDLPPDEDWRCNHIRLNKPGVDISPIVRQSTIARDRGADILIASLHMGNAYQPYPSAHIQNTIHRICKQAQVDVIVGGHPHNPQPIEWFRYKDSNSIQRKSLIFYSLGDFVAYDIYSWAHLALLVKLKISKKGTDVYVSGFEILPAYLMAERRNREVTKLVFKHFEEVIPNVEYTDAIRKDIESVNDLYHKRLFTNSQRDQVIFPQCQ